MKQAQHLSMIRSFHLADWFTLGNAACGVGALFAVMTYLQNPDVLHLFFACALVLLALIFDILDGKVARWRQQSSVLGRELDSLADVISFGVAPAVIAYGAGMNGLWDLMILIYFVVFGVSRLARYNVTAETLSQGTDKVKYFEGTPIPSSLLLVIVIAIAASLGAIGSHLWLGVVHIGPWRLHPLVLMFALSGSLMISRTLHIPKL
jgi:CDP-diacylglycerol--serine O-phosphatidyltransferase